MLTFDGSEFVDLARGLSMGDPATMKAALLVGPEAFDVSTESAADNRYVCVESTANQERASEQHRLLQNSLEALGVPVFRFEGRVPQCDGVFVNNAFATTSTRLILGSMHHPGRRDEPRREDIRSALVERFGYEVQDLSSRDLVAELTGSLVVDRPRNVAFCGLSRRADRAGAAAMHEAFGFAATYAFELDASEYHTNVVLSVLAGRACVVFEPSVGEPVGAVLDALYDGRVLRLSAEEKAGFVGNCLAATPDHVMMSDTAALALEDSSRRTLEAWGFQIVAVDVTEFEKSGGSLRCLIGELY